MRTRFRLNALRVRGGRFLVPHLPVGTENHRSGLEERVSRPAQYISAQGQQILEVLPVGTGQGPMRRFEPFQAISAQPLEKA